MQIPHSDVLSTSTMNRVFDNTVATYKFYWLLSLLDKHVKEHRAEMLALDVASRMVAYAWYPIEYFRLSFGKKHVKQKVDERFHPDGYNIGINVGEAAAQSVFHRHMHLIPRYKGDVPDPKGGVRGVIPSR